MSFRSPLRNPYDFDQHRSSRFLGGLRNDAIGSVTPHSQSLIYTICHHTAINEQVGTGDPAGGRGHEEKAGVGDVFGPA